MKNLQVLLAGIGALLLGIGLAGVIYYAFVVPGMVAVWAEEGRVLSSSEQTAAGLSRFCSQSGLILIPALLLAVIGCIVWAIIAGRKNS